jgi:hypothetical protein
MCRFATRIRPPPPLSGMWQPIPEPCIFLISQIGNTNLPKWKRGKWSDGEHTHFSRRIKSLVAKTIFFFSFSDYMKWMQHFCREKRKGRDHMGYGSVCKRMILKLIWKEQDLKMWTFHLARNSTQWLILVDAILIVTRREIWRPTEGLSPSRKTEFRGLHK